MMDESKGRVTGSKVLYSGKVLTLRLDEVALPGGATVEREIIEHAGVVAMVPVDGDGKVHLVRQYRPAIEKSLLEIPAGGIEPGEDAMEAARREMQEEIGMLPSSLEPLGGFYPVPGYSNEYIHLFLARDLQPASLPGDEDEIVSVETMPIAELVSLIDAGKVDDGKTIAGVLRAVRYLNEHNAPSKD